MELLTTFWKHFMMIIATPKLIWGLVSVIAALAVIVVLIKLHFSGEYKDFNLLKIFAYDQLGQPSATKIRLNIAFVISSWAFVYLTMMNMLTEWYVLIFMSVWVADNIFAKKQKLETKLKLSEEEKND